jgi:predicted DCC family thiol-disulfide oxidoreductase YuxK
MTRAEPPIIVFDALCPLCSANAQFILTHDRKRLFRLASMQRPAGAALFRRFGIDPANPETLILVVGDKVFRNSDAIIEIYGALGWPWRLLRFARAVPRMVRDPFYRWVARNRYRFFGRRETCWLPSAELSDRIL